MCDGVEARGGRGRGRGQRSIYRVHYALLPQRPDMRPLVLPTDPRHVQAYDQQVAGHKDTKDAKYLGLLQCTNGTILKPILKDSQKREVDFYTRLSTTSDPDLLELRKFVPKYFGCTKITYNGHEQEYIVLEHLTKGMLEPCIMDVKIGKRTWDPLASPQKIKNEQTKYARCKQQYGFCIPGFQVYKLDTGKLLRYNKDHGKKLHGDLVKDAIRKYLNGACGAGVCRALVLQQLAALWRLQRWAGGPRRTRIYCASLLLLYDAAPLRRCCGDRQHALHPRGKCQKPQPQPIPRRRHTISASSGSNFSGQISALGPIYRKLSPVRTGALTLVHSAFAPPPPLASPWTEALDRLGALHSENHNYEDHLSKIKIDYRAQLDQLAADSSDPKPWATVKLIDFAHAFFNDEEDPSVDDNFREGIDNFVAIFESLLRETDDQVF